MSLANTLFRNATSNWLILLVNIIIFYFLTPFVIEKLGKDQYGAWVLIISITSFMQLFDFGMSGALRRFISHHEARDEFDQIRAILSNVAVVYAGLAFLLVVVVYTISILGLQRFGIEFSNAPVVNAAFLIAGIDISLIIFFNLFAGTLWALQRFDLVNYGNLFCLLLRTAGTVYFLVHGYGLVAMAFVVLATNLASHAYKVICTKIVYPRFAISLSSVSRIKLLQISGFSGIGFVTSVANIGLRQCMPIVTAALVSVTAVGYLALVQSLVNYCTQVIGSFSGVTGPAISLLYSRNEKKQIAALVLDGQKYIAYVAFLLCIGLMVFGDIFIGLWVNAEFAQQTRIPLIALAVSASISLPQSIAHSLLLYTNKHRLNMKITLWLLALALALQIALGAVWALNGVAAGFLAAHLVIYGAVLPGLISQHIGCSCTRYLSHAYGLPLMATLPFITLSLLVRCYLAFTSVLQLLIVAMGLAITHCTVVYFCAMNISEKAFIKQKVASVFSISR